MSTRTPAETGRPSSGKGSCCSLPIRRRWSFSRRSCRQFVSTAGRVGVQIAILGVTSVVTEFVILACYGALASRVTRMVSMSAWRLGKARWRAYCRSRRRWASPQYAGSRRPRPSRQSGEPGRFWQNAPEPGRCLCAWVRFHGKSTTRRCQWWMTRARGHLPRGSSTPSRRSTVPPPSRRACGGRGTRPFHSDW